MCFFIHPKYRKMKTAKRDITCYKEGFCFRDGWEEFFYPRFYYYRYSLGQLNKIVGEWPIQPPTLQWSFPGSITEIHEGFHSYSNKKQLSRGYDKVKCIIPKGAHYFYNPDTQEYASNQIIVQEFI